jgi:hypothetical protein
MSAVKALLEMQAEQCYPTCVCVSLCSRNSCHSNGWWINCAAGWMLMWHDPHGRRCYNTDLPVEPATSCTQPPIRVAWIWTLCRGAIYMRGSYVRDVEALTALTMEAIVLTQCNLLQVYRRFGGSCGALRFKSGYFRSEDAGSTFLWNFSEVLPD